MAMLLIALPGAAYVVGIEVIRWFGGGEAPRAFDRLRRPGARLAARISSAGAGVLDGLERVGLARRHRPEPVPSVLLALELRRLGAEVRRIEAGDQPHRAARLAAALAAYDHVLVQLCAQARVPTPTGLLPLHPRHRLDLEADLVASGLDW